MKPAPFDYAKPSSVEEVFDLLDRYRDEARLLAGGQSLIPSLNMRLSAPAR
jgi:CO/xanthine dehydrogenase FAD-binding subunit